jgi:membrane protein HdeD
METDPTPAVVVLERRRTGWDVALGVLSIVAGFVALGHVALASAISLLFLGWTLVIGGLALLVSGVAGWRDPDHRWGVVGGALLGLLGIGVLRNLEASLLVLTLFAGSLLLFGGIVRIVAAFQVRAARGVLLLNGIVTTLLGLVVFVRWPVSALWFLGVVLGVQLIVDGVTTATVGRVRVVGDRPRAQDEAVTA